MRDSSTSLAVQHIQANGLSFAYLEWGEGPLVLLVHGFPDTAWTWDAVGPALAEAGFRAVAPFTRGIAPTEIPADGDYSNDTLGQDLLALIGALDDQPAVLVGHDFGAAASYSAAGLGGEMVAKLVTLAIPHPATLKLSLGKAWGVRHFLTHRLPGAASRFARNNYDEIRVLYERWSPGFAWNDTEFSAARHAYAQPGCMQASLDYYKALTPKMSPGLRARIAAPSLVIGGLSDGIATTADFEGSTRRFTGPVRVQMLPGGHFLHREHPAPFIEALLAFLAE